MRNYRNPTTGHTPFEMLYGRPCVLPTDLLVTPELVLDPVSTEVTYPQSLARRFSRIYSDIHDEKERYLAAQKDLKQLYLPGEVVKVRTPKTRLDDKLSARWTGPWTVLKEVSHGKGVTFLVEYDGPKERGAPKAGSRIMVHANRMAPWID